MWPFRKPDPLDKVLFKYDDGTPFDVRQLLKSVGIFGQTGSGKSSGSNLLLSRKILALGNSGGLILASKPEDRDWWIERFTEAKRLDDLIIFAPDQKHRCNFIDSELKAGGDATSLTQFAMVTGESLAPGARKGEQFWEMGNKVLLYNAISAILLSKGELSIPNLSRFISTAPLSQEDAQTERILSGFHYTTMVAAAERIKEAGDKVSPIEKGDFEQAKDYWGNQFMYMDHRTRSGILAGVTNLLHVYNTGITREMVSTTTTVSPADMWKRKFILVDFPIDKYQESGKIIMTGFKLLAQKAILRHHAKPEDPVIVLHCDEFQDVVNSFDAAFLAKCRSHKGAMITLTQSLHSYFGEMQQDKAKSLLTNKGTLIFHCIGDPDTAKYGSDMQGQFEATKINLSPRGGFEDPGASANLHRSWEPCLQPKAFMSGLRSGGKHNNYCVDGIVMKVGEPFKSGSNFIYQVFKQRG